MEPFQHTPADDVTLRHAGQVLRLSVFVFVIYCPKENFHMTDKTYSTAQVSGMLDMPIRTIQGYVHDLRDCFSETARKPAKGRQFTDADIKILLTIRRARAMRMTDDEIRKIISGEVSLPLAQEYSEADIKNIAVSAYEKLEITAQFLNTCNETMTNIRTSSGRLWQTVRVLQEENAKLIKQVEQLRNWQLHMMKVDPDFNPYDNQRELQKEFEETTAQDAQPTEKKRAGLMGWLSGE
jgi:DNA-binding transcriptional MerR regulator